MTPESHMRPSRPRPGACLVAAGIALALMASPASAAVPAGESDADWSPRSSERLIKMPANYLKKAVDQDYARSPLAAALAGTEESLRLKVRTLQDLQGAIEQGEGELQTELRHQLLAEKREYLNLVARQQKLRTQRARTRMRVYENLLGRMNRDKGAMTPRQMELVQKQQQAKQRFESSIAAVDAKLFRSSVASESRYAQEYARNVAAIEKLVAAINVHPMNAQPEIDGTPATREDYIRLLIAENEADLSVLEQEQTILGFMAKLVALDATALAEGATGGTDGVATADAPQPGVQDAVDFFVSR